MIIDSHLHFGNVVRFNLTEEILLSSMKKYSIDFGLVSNIEAIEYDFDRKPVSIINQYEANLKILQLCKKHPDTLKGLFWIKPVTETLDEKSKKLILENKDVFVGFKAHPYHSQLKVTDRRYTPYFEFASIHNLPFAVHTCIDSWSDCQFLHEVALQYPHVKFIAVHMDLRSDYKKSVEYIKNTPNLYGDTTWVNDGKTVAWILQECGMNKIIFGSDAPIDGVDTYSAYREMIEYLKKSLTPAQWNMVFANNAKNIFKI